MPNSKILFFLPLIFCLLFPFLAAESSTFARRISPRSLGFHEEKLTHLHFFFHDVASGPNPTMRIIAEPEGRAKDTLPFGTTVIIEDPLTAGPEPESKLIGKAQGLYTSISQVEMALMMVMTFAFTEGEFNGSTLSVLGRNNVELAVREMPIVGGTGVFQFARGIARTNFVTVDFSKGDAIVEYNVYVYHYSTPDLHSSSSSNHAHFEEGLEYMVDPILAKIEPTVK
ncbi:20S proteasome component beta 5 [Stylosanthes scabra]|uniref:Dirigent protein n=1 Tax=Stylosanthes scabra TaxID=79078 RepID=A0ABU6RIB5_9FABA|nr:20S proteasome component beta 5 [Stylosanthes scabra]